MNKIPKEYELFYFLPITFSPEEVSSTKEKIASIITKYGGSITKEEDMGKKKLSFTIKGARHGYYLLTCFSSEPTASSLIGQEIKLIPQIIRHRLVIKENYKMPHLSNAPAAEKQPVPTIETSIEETKKEHETGKVDMQELNRKIDELLLENV
jgi:small subunit ribosomal protein S6